MDVYMYDCDKCKQIEVCPSLEHRTCNKKLKVTKGEKTELILEKIKREDYYEWVKYHHICNECGTEMKEMEKILKQIRKND